MQGTGGNDHLGGLDFDFRISEHLQRMAEKQGLCTREETIDSAQLKQRFLVCIFPFSEIEAGGLIDFSTHVHTHA